MNLDWSRLAGADLQAFLLVLSRVAVLFGFVPVFGLARVPPIVRIGAAAMVSVVLFPTVQWDPVSLPVSGPQLAWGMVQQFFVGFTLALIAWVVFLGVQMAGQAIDLTMGLGIVNVLDPLTQQQESVLGQFLYLLSLLLYFAVDGHLWLLKGFAQSFDAVPILSVSAPGGLFMTVAGNLAILFAAAAKLAGPGIVVLVLTNLVLRKDSFCA